MYLFNVIGLTGGEIAGIIIGTLLPVVIIMIITIIVIIILFKRNKGYVHAELFVLIRIVKSFQHR